MAFTETKVVGIGRGLGTALVALVFTLGCNNPGGAAGGNSATSSSGLSPTKDGVMSTPQSTEVVEQIGYDSFLPDGSGASPTGGSGGSGGTAGSSGSGGTAYPPDNAVSVTCGDRVVGLNVAFGHQEECDDGDEGSDACTAQCQTRDQPVLPASGEEHRNHNLGIGRHPVSGGSDGFVVAFTDLTGDAPLVSASVYNRFGQRQATGVVSSGGQPLLDANPVTAALPGGSYAVAWTDFDGDGADLGIALRLLDAQHEVGGLKFANAGREFTQRDADLIWDGTQLVAAWVDFSDPNSGPDLRYRTFDAQLNPTSDDLTLAASDLPEAAVALAPFSGGWAAAYREGQGAPGGNEYVVVKAANHTTRVGPILGGPIEDRPALVALDGSHLLVVFSEAVVPADGPANFTRLSYAVVDSSVDTTLVGQPLNPQDQLWNRSPAVSQLSPSAEIGPNGVYVAWRSEALASDAAGDQLWLKYLGWSTNPGSASPSLHAGETELLLPRTCEESVGDQRVPALAHTPLAPWGALAVAWEDYGRTQGAGGGQPEVVVQLAPTHPRDSAEATANYFEEHWDGADGSAWNSHWTGTLSGGWTVTTQRLAGQIALTSSGTSVLEAVNDQSALNADLVTDVRIGFGGRAGLFVRRTDADPSSYLAFQFGAPRDEPWRIYAMLSGVQTDIVVGAPPSNVPFRNNEYTYKMRFRASTATDGSLFVAARVWPAEQTEPSTWSLQQSLPANSTIATQLGLPGHFGVLAKSKLSRKVTFDDFRAKFFSGSVLGDLDGLPATWALPLKRELASYRRCTPEHPCEEFSGCCTGPAECDSGAACSSKLSLNQPLGSHADACVVDHCANGKRDADEERPDCGGAACALCSCQVSATIGTTAYCPSTCPCGTGDATCTADAGCVAGLSCSTLSGPRYGYAAGTGACTPFHCANANLDVGETWPDCGGECGTCNVVDVTPSSGSINATAGSLQKLVGAATTITSVTGLAEGQNLCILTDVSGMKLGALAFNRVQDFTLTPGVAACFVVDADLNLQSTNLPPESVTAPSDVANLDWKLSNEPNQFQLSGSSITRWLASAGGSVRDVAQSTASLQPTYSDGGAVMAGTRYLISTGALSDWTFLHRPGTLFMVVRYDGPPPGTPVSPGYLLGTLHEGSPSAGSGYGVYLDTSYNPPRLRFRVANGSASYVYALNTLRALPIGRVTVLAATLTDTKLEVFREYDSIGSDTNTGMLSTAAPFAVAVVGAKASTTKVPFPGTIFEIEHYSGAMSQKARQAMIQYLMAKYGVTEQVQLSQGITVDSEGGVVLPGSTTPPDCATSATSRVLGNWGVSQAVPGYQGSSYLTDNDVASAKDEKRVCFKPTLTQSRNYAVYMWWTALSNRASNTPVDIRHANGTTRVVVDQRSNGGQWNYLGTYPMTNDGASYVEILATGTDGNVIADAIQLR